MICACGADYEPPHPAWLKCMACTVSPHVARKREQTGVSDVPVWATKDSVIFTVPGMPVSKNDVYAVAWAQATRPRGRQAWIYLTKNAKKFITSVQNHAIAAFTRPGIGIWDCSRRFELSLHTYFDNPRADVGMALWLTQDALEGVLYGDDNQVIDAHDRKELVPKGQARMVVTVRAAP